MKNVFTIDADIKLKMLINEPTVVQNDDIRFVINVFDNGQPLDLSSVETVSLANVRLDGKTVVTPGTKIDTNIVQFDLGTEETKVSGRVEATAQFYDSEGRVSTVSFSYRVVKDPTGDGYIPTEREQTLIETVLGDGPLIIQQAQDAAEYATAQGQFAQAQADYAHTQGLLIDNLKTLGEYDPSVTYKKNNIVRYNGSSYIAKQTTVGNPPTDTTYWELLAQKGLDGTGSVTSVNGKTGAVSLTASDVGAETPSGAQAKADQAEQNAVKKVNDALAAHSAEIASKFTNINLNIIDMAVELETLKGATLNGVTANIFIETFNNLNDINLMNGVYDSTNKRLVL